MYIKKKKLLKEKNTDSSKPKIEGHLSKLHIQINTFDQKFQF